MAKKGLFRIIITDPIVQPMFSSFAQLASFDRVEIFYEPTDGITVEVNGVLQTIPFELGLLIQNWKLIGGSSSFHGTLLSFISSYSFCASTTLNWFLLPVSFPTFPCAVRKETINSPVCAIAGGAVCDLVLNGPVLVTNTSNLTNPNGIIVMNASGSNGTIKYGLTNFTYASEGQLSGTFLGVGVGRHTVYAKDANDCTIQISVFVYYTPEEQEHYRASWKTLSTGRGASRNERIRIYEREYVGSVVEIEAGETSPLFIQKPKQGGDKINDKLYPVHPTNAELLFKSLYDYQFLPLFTQDNKKFRVVYEIDNGSGFEEELQWFISPSVFTGSFTPGIPTTANIRAGDNVKELEKEKFDDGNGNLLTGRMKLIKIISHVMKRTGLNLKIRAGINIFEDNHTILSDGSSDPLDQTYKDVDCYREEDEPFTCWRVLESILRPFGARILQSNNQWIIEEIDRAFPSYDYRVFDSNGEYESNGTFNSIIDAKNPSEIDRATLVGRDHSEEVIPAYGKITIISFLNYIGTVKGGFEKSDLLSPESEVFSPSGVFTSEEGFRDWTLRLNGTEGVSFGRVELGKTTPERGRQRISFDINEIGRSVGAFYFDTGSWEGNLRDAYIESSPKAYQYGPGDELKLKFEYTTPPTPAFEFMVLRFVLKLGNMYLQQNGTWDVAEYIYRAYPTIQGSFQSFEINVPTPDTDDLVDTTLQVRIYYYARHFFDFGIPNNTGTIADGVDGQALLKAHPTLTVEDDFRCDVRDEYNIATRARRYFYELRNNSAGEDIPNVVRPNDYDTGTNEKTFHLLKSVQDNDELTNRSRGLDVKFYLDNITVDSLPSGQPPPTEEKISLTISEYLPEVLEIELYNVDLPNITNAKNMYNNIFRLEDGTPTSLWFRTGINERLPLQQILLKVLAANHSAPTFRLTGSFINEFQRIGMNNYLRVTKEGSNLSLLNSGFTIDLDEWTGDGSGEPFTWDAGNGGSAEVSLTGAENSERRYQVISQNGGHIKITANIHIIPGLTNTREDILWLLFYRGNDVVYAEKLITFRAFTSADDENFTYIAHLPKHIDRIGFYIRKVTGSGTCVYQIGEFGVEGIDIQEVYQIVDYKYDARMSIGVFELMQMSKTYISLAGIDSGGNNQSGGGEGNSFSGDFNNDFGGDYDTILN